MNRTVRRTLCLLAIVSLSLTLLSSCFYVNTGKALRQSTITHTGVDVQHPEGGTVYRRASDNTFYMLVPEATYTARLRYIGMNNLYSNEPGRELVATGIRHTGRKMWVQVSPDRTNDLVSGRPGIRCRWQYVRNVDALPAGAAPYLSGETFDDPSVKAGHLGDFSSKKGLAYWPAAIISYPFTYVIDPVAMFALNVTWPVSSFMAGAGDALLCMATSPSHKHPRTPGYQKINGASAWCNDTEESIAVYQRGGRAVFCGIGVVGECFTEDELVRSMKKKDKLYVLHYDDTYVPDAYRDALEARLRREGIRYCIYNYW